jgi:hypothetical protein
VAGGGAAAPASPAGGVAAGAAGAAELSAGAAAAGGGADESAGGAVLADSCLAQAASKSAATKALRASFVFIEQYPEKKTVREETYKKSSNCFVCHRRFYRLAPPF